MKHLQNGQIKYIPIHQLLIEYKKRDMESSNGRKQRGEEKELRIEWELNRKLKWKTNFI